LKKQVSSPGGGNCIAGTGKGSRKNDVGCRGRPQLKGVSESATGRGSVETHKVMIKRKNKRAREGAQTEKSLKSKTTTQKYILKGKTRPGEKTKIEISPEKRDKKTGKLRP